MANVKELLEIEYALIGSIILNGWNIDKDTLKEEDFTNPINYELYKHLDEFYRENDLSDIADDLQKFSMFSAYLHNKGLLEKYKKAIHLAELNGLFPAKMQPFLAEQLKKNSAAKKLKNIALQIARSEIDIEEIIPQIEQTIQEVKETRTEGLRKVDISQFMTTEPPKIDFVVNGLPVSSIGILASPGGLGKSMFVLELLTAVASGRDITEGAINIHGKTGKCTYLSLEDPDHILHYRIFNLMAFLHPKYRDKLQENLSIYTQKEIFELVDAQGLINQKNLDELKKIAEGQRLVVVDTLRRVHSADENKAGQMSTLLQAFEVVAKETGAAFLLVHHTGKAQGSNSRGSSVLYDNIRYQINLEPVQAKDAQQLGVSNHRRLVKLVNTKSNYGPLEEDQLLYRIDHGVLRLYDAEIAADY